MRRAIPFFPPCALLAVSLCCCVPGGPEPTVTYLTSSSLPSQNLSAETKSPPISRSIETYTTTPTSFSGSLLRLHFHSSSAIDPAQNYFPPDLWALRIAGDSEDDAYAAMGTVQFDLTRPQDVSEGRAAGPPKAGFGIFHSVFLEFTYIDVTFEFASSAFSIRICTSNRDGCVRGDLLMKDTDGTFKWISRSGDPNSLVSVRPADPVYNYGIAVWASGWAGGDSTATIFVTEAAIPDDALFDVPSVEAGYSVKLDFNLTNIISLQNIDQLNYTKRDVLEKLVVVNFLGKGGDYHLQVRPTVVLLGN